MRQYFTLIFTFLSLSLFSQSISFGVDTAYAADPFFDPEIGVEVMALFEGINFQVDPGTDNDFMEANTEFTKVDLPAEWQFDFMEVLIGGNFATYPNAVNSAPYGETDEDIIAVHIMGLDMGNQVSPGVITIDILMYDSQNEAIRDDITLVLNVCPQQTEADLITIPGSGNFCLGEIIELTATSGYSEYNWTNGQDGQTVQWEITGPFITCYAYDDFGCFYFDERIIEVQSPHREQLCAVTVDPTEDGNLLVWEKTPDVGTQHFNIYKQTSQFNIFELTHSQPYEELSEYLDTEANPNMQSERYYITTDDICENESEPTLAHKTMHLTSNLGTNDEVNLIWEPYDGFNYNTFNIYRGDGISSMELIAERPSNTFTYTDIDPPSNETFYAIEVVAPDICESSRALNAVRSNVKNVMVNASNEVKTKDFILFPNPTNDVVTILGLENEIKSTAIVSIYNSIGTLMGRYPMMADRKIDLKNLAAGRYFVNIIGTQHWTSLVKK